MRGSQPDSSYVTRPALQNLREIWVPEGDARRAHIALQYSTRNRFLMRLERDGLPIAKSLGHPHVQIISAGSPVFRLSRTLGALSTQFRLKLPREEWYEIAVNQLQEVHKLGEIACAESDCRLPWHRVHPRAL